MILFLEIKINILFLLSSIEYHSIIKYSYLTSTQKRTINKHKSYEAKNI